jgi:hypothetical protein
MRADASWYEGVETRATYASSTGHGLIDRSLYLPKSWTEDPERRAAAGVPDEVERATKPALARGDDHENLRARQLAQLSHFHEGRCPCI